MIFRSLYQFYFKKKKFSFVKQSQAVFSVCANAFPNEPAHPVVKTSFPSPKTIEFKKNFGTTNDNFQSELYTAGLRLAYNPRIQLSGFYQYNTIDSRGRWNIRGSWEFAPLSFLHLVFNENNFKNSPLQNQSFISKLTYLKQF